MRSQVLVETPSKAEASCPLSFQCSKTFLTARSPAGVSLSRSASPANVCGTDDATAAGIAARRALGMCGLHQVMQNIAPIDVPSSSSRDRRYHGRAEDILEQPYPLKCDALAAGLWADKHGQI